MESSTANQIMTPGNQNFFLSPQFPLQRQYEALRAYLVEEEPSGDVARRFGYSPGFFRVLCYQFRHDPQKRASFFRQPHRGPQSSPTRDRVRELAVAMTEHGSIILDGVRTGSVQRFAIQEGSGEIRNGTVTFSNLPQRPTIRTRPTLRRADDRQRFIARCVERYGESFAVFVDGDPASIHQLNTPAKRQAFIESAPVRPWEARPFPSAHVQ